MAGVKAGVIDEALGGRRWAAYGSIPMLNGTADADSTKDMRKLVSPEYYSGVVADPALTGRLPPA